MVRPLFSSFYIHIHLLCVFLAPLLHHAAILQPLHISRSSLCVSKQSVVLNTTGRAVTS